MLWYPELQWLPFEVRGSLGLFESVFAAAAACSSAYLKRSAKSSKLFGILLLGLFSTCIEEILAKCEWVASRMPRCNLLGVLSPNKLSCELLRPVLLLEESFK